MHSARLLVVAALTLGACGSEPVLYFPGAGGDAGADATGSADGVGCDGDDCDERPALPTACASDGECSGAATCVAGVCRVAGDPCIAIECPASTTCVDGRCVAVDDPCASMTCPTGTVCARGECVALSCTPPCAASQQCIAGVCTVASADTLCEPCASDSDCDGGSCVVIAGTAICGQTCEGDTGCPSGFVCYPFGDATGSQCVPGSGACEGCLVDGCPDGTWCDATDVACSPFQAICGECRTNVECGPGAVCSLSGGERVCLQRCGTDDRCPSGSSCGSILGQSVCAPTGETCGGDTCTRSCSAPTPILRADCECVACLEAGDCRSGQVCNTAGACVQEASECSTTSECDGGYCQGGVCVECMTNSHCAGDETCISGSCAACSCPPGQICGVGGECVTATEPVACTSDAQCIATAIALGHSGEGARCDRGGVGCFIVGLCTGSGGDGGGLPFPGIGDGGATDPFEAPCPRGTTCALTLDLGSGSFLVSACSGCTIGDASSCRPGEVCRESLLDLLGTGPVCGAEGSGGGGGGLPFP